MVNRTALSESEITKRLKDFPAWIREEQNIVFVKKFPEYLMALDFVHQLGKASEENDHHPEININYKTVTVRYSTHSAGGLTELDFKMARVLEDILASFSR